MDSLISNEIGFLKQRNLVSNGTHVTRVATPLTGLIFVHPDSDVGKLYVIFKCFRDTDTTAKSVSSNSSSKNSDTAIYANRSEERRVGKECRL